MIYLVLFLVFTTCNGMFRDQQRSRILINRVNPSSQNNRVLFTNQQHICGSSNIVPDSTLGFKQTRNKLTSLPISTKYTRPLFDFMGRPMFLRESKSLSDSQEIGFGPLPSSRFQTTAQNRPQTITSQSSFQNFQNRNINRNFKQNRNRLRRPNDILTRTQRLKSLTSTRNSIISAGTRNAGIF